MTKHKVRARSNRPSLPSRAGGATPGGRTTPRARCARRPSAFALLPPAQISIRWFVVVVVHPGNISLLLSPGWREPRRFSSLLRAPARSDHRSLAPRPPPQRLKDENGNDLPQPPKRARTAYLVFCDKHRAQIMRDVHPEPDAKFTREEMQQVTTRLAERWKNVAPDELAACKAEADRLKDEYEAAKVAFGPGLMRRSNKSKKNKRARIIVEGVGEKPKRARTAYLIFCDRYRNLIMKEVHSDPTTKFTREEMQQVTTRLADMWKNVHTEVLAECKAEAEECKRVYQEQKDKYVPPVYASAKGGKKGKKGKGRDDGKPKRPRTAYLIFAEDERARLKKLHPDMDFTDTSRWVSREWKELPDNKRNAYMRPAEKEQDKHRMAKASWEAKNTITPAMNMGGMGGVHPGVGGMQVQHGHGMDVGGVPMVSA